MKDLFGNTTDETPVKPKNKEKPYEGTAKPTAKPKDEAVKPTAKPKAESAKPKEEPTKPKAGSSTFRAAQTIAEEDNETGASRTNQNGKQAVKFKQWAILKKTIALALVAAAVAVAAGLGINSAVKNGELANSNAEEAGKNATTAMNTADDLVESAEWTINNTNTTVTTASNLVSQVGGETEAEDENTAKILASISSEVRQETASSMSVLLSEAQTALNSANTEYQTMQSSQTQMKVEYDNQNWDRVNEIGSSISTNSSNISSYTKTATDKANEVISNINQLLADAEQAIQDAQESLEKTQASAEKLYAQLPSFDETLNDAFVLIQSSIDTIQNYINKGADEATNAELDGYKQSALTSQVEAQNEKLSYDSIKAEVETAYANGEYNTVIDLMKQLSDLVATIGGHASSASDNALSAAEAYANYQEAVNDELSQPIINITFTADDLANYQGIKQYLLSADLGGDVNSVEQCTYNKNNGEVTLLVNCTSYEGKQYRNLLTATIAPGLTNLDASSLISRMNAGKVQSQVFDSEMEMSGNGSLTQGNVTVNGNVEVQYSIDCSYNSSTKQTEVTAKAIVVVKDANGNVSTKVYNAGRDFKRGRVSEAEVQDEYVSKLKQMIEADMSIEITSEASTTLSYELQA